MRLSFIYIVFTLVVFSGSNAASQEDAMITTDASDIAKEHIERTNAYKEEASGLTNRDIYIGISGAMSALRILA